MADEYGRAGYQRWWNVLRRGLNRAFMKASKVNGKKKNKMEITIKEE